MFGRILRGLILVLALAVAALWWLHRDLSPAAVEADYAAPNDEFVEAAGLRARVRIDGPADAPVLLLAHGFTDSLETWEAWTDELDDDYRVIRVDLPAHGLTGPDPEERYAPDDLGAFLGAVMDSLDVDRAYVGGNSMGGLAAWRFAAAHPERVDKLILVDPAVYPLDDEGEVPLAMQILLRMAPGAGVEAVYQLATEADAAVTPEIVARTRAMWRRDGNGAGMVATMDGFVLDDPTETLAGMQTPTLILWGAADQVIPVEDGRRMAEAMPNAELIVYDDLGHMPQIEAPARSAADVRSFLEE